MVPEGWKKSNIDKLSSFVTSGSRGWAKYYSESGCKFYRITNLRRDNILPDESNMKFVSLPGGMNEGTRTSLKKGDLLISITADLGIIGYIDNDENEPRYINQHVSLVRPKHNEIHAQFLAYLLASYPYEKLIKRMNDAGAKAGLNLSTIKSVPVSYPSLPEQTRITEILSTWDRSIATTEKLMANSERQKKALMQQLLTGKKRLPGFSEAWETVKLGEIANCLDNRRVPLNKSQREENQGGVPYYGANGIVDYVNDNIFDQDLVLLAEDGGYFDEFSSRPIAQFIKGKSWVNNHAHILSAKKDTTEKWLFYSLVHKNILAFVNAGTRAKLNKKDMLSIPIHLPLVLEQNAIIFLLDTAFSDVEILREKLAVLKQEKSALIQQLLTGKRRVKINGEVRDAKLVS